ncbi:unnamed protein product [Dicrocoelium dendriticum]|nr:unnamed protein product [Dicrocoelium dendriticum]
MSAESLQRCKNNQRRHFEEQLALAAKTAPKRIFVYVKRRLKPAGDVPVLDGTDGQLLTSSSEPAATLAAHFASVFANSQVSVLSSTCTAFTELDSLHGGVEEVAQLLAKLDGTKPAGPDVLHPLVLKSLSTILSPIVTDLSNWSLS